MITDEAVQLTDAQQSRKGWIWNTQVRFLSPKSDDFEPHKLCNLRIHFLCFLPTPQGDVALGCALDTFLHAY